MEITSPFMSVHTSPMGLIPKPHTDEWKLIVDLSSPYDASVNNGIAWDICSLQYASVDEAVCLVMCLGPGIKLIKMDLSKALRMVPVHPDDHHLLGIQWQGVVYLDRSLPFGLRSAPKIFTAVADFLAWALFCEGLLLIHYLDDFLLFISPGMDPSQCQDIALTTFARLGAPVAAHKTAGPATSLTFLGICIDTVACQLSLPEEKVSRLLSLVEEWKDRKKCRLQELHSFVGHLSHAATVIRPGRIFLRRLFALLARQYRPHHFVRLDTEVRGDIQWWHCLLNYWNKRSFFPLPSPSCHVFSDASSSFGCGAVCYEFGQWFQLQWPLSWTNVNIAVKEMVPVVVAAAVWGPQLTGNHVCFHSDNEAVVCILKRCSVKDRCISQLLRCLFFYSAYYNFQYSAVHIPGNMNIVADAISRNNMIVLSSLAPQVSQTAVHAWEHQQFFFYCNKHRIGAQPLGFSCSQVPCSQRSFLHISILLLSLKAFY